MSNTGPRICQLSEQHICQPAAFRMGQATSGLAYGSKQSTTIYVRRLVRATSYLLPTLLTVWLDMPCHCLRPLAVVNLGCERVGGMLTWLRLSRMKGEQDVRHQLDLGESSHDLRRFSRLTSYGKYAFTYSSTGFSVVSDLDFSYKAWDLPLPSFTPTPIIPSCLRAPFSSSRSQSTLPTPPHT